MSKKQNMTFVRYRCRSHLDGRNVAIYQDENGSLLEVGERISDGGKFTWPRSIDAEEAEQTLSPRDLNRVLRELEDW
jgi:hypothetical protein